MLKKQKFDIQGMTFQVKPTTRNNVKLVTDYFDDNDGEIVIEDTIQAWFEVFRLVTDPVGDADHSKIDIDDWDMKLGEAALVSFMPTLTTTLGGLAGS